MVKPVKTEETLVDEKDKLCANALHMLQKESVQRKLASLLAGYLNDVQPIIVEATVQNAGVRPSGLENEVYSCFHHIARGLCVYEADGETEQEIEKAEDSHLKRVLLDSYKIAICPSLKEYQFVVEDLYHLSLDKDFNPEIYGPESIKKIQKILELKTQVKNAYKKAKLHESCGEIEQAIGAYDNALAECGNLRRALAALMKGDVYIVAKAHAARKRAEQNKDKKANKWHLWISHFIAAGALLVAFCAWYFPRVGMAPAEKQGQQTEAPIEVSR